MADAEKKPFLSGVSGTIAGVAALVTAIGGLIGALAAVGVIGGGGSSGSHSATGTVAAGASSDWASGANKICAQANDTINALPDPNTLNLQSGARILRQGVRISQQMFRDLAALPKPSDKQARIDKFLQLGTRTNEVGATLADDLRLKNFPGAIQAQHSLSQLGQRLDSAAIALGATTCAEGSSSLSVGLPGG